MDKRRIVRFLRELSTAVDSLSDKEFEALLGDLKGELISRPRVPSQRGRKMSAEDIGGVVQKMSVMNSRIEALDYIDNMRLSRRELSDVAKSVGVYISSQDNIEVIQNKIVEELIGSRLNSEAIRGSRSD